MKRVAFLVCVVATVLIAACSGGSAPTPAGASAAPSAASTASAVTGASTAPGATPTAAAVTPTPAVEPTAPTSTLGGEGDLASLIPSEVIQLGEQDPSFPKFARYVYGVGDTVFTVQGGSDELIAEVFSGLP